MFCQNDYEVISVDYSNEVVRIDVRLTSIQPTELMALLELREKIEAKIFDARLSISQNKDITSTVEGE